MTTRIRPLTAAVMTFALASVAAYAVHTVADDKPEAPAPWAGTEAPSASGSGISGNMQFVDEHGNPRIPTDAEMRALADALKRDLARIAGPHAGKRYERTEARGAVAATVATGDLVFLTASENGDGTVSVGHSITAPGTVATKTATDAPEM